MNMIRERFQEEERTTEESGAEDGGEGSLAFFGHDTTDSTVIKRASAFQACGVRVVGFMFSRPRPGRGRVSWQNVDLGTTTDWRYATRLLKIVRALFVVARHRDLLEACRVFYARNIDMLLIAVVARALTRTRPVMVYEVLDVQTVFVGGRLVNRVFRALERLLLRSTDLLVVSSPEFISNYFQPLQGYKGPWHLLENKVSAQQSTIAERCQEARAKPGPPWVIGWFGNVRCVRSLTILSKIADELGDRVLISIRGTPPEVHLPARMIAEAAAERRNIVFGGPYAAPQDLPALYGNVHFTWCVDYLDAGTNSDWLLPNRIYEGGLMGSVAIARKDTATGRMVEREGLGWALGEPLEEAVIAALRGLTPEHYEHMRRTVENKDRSLFVDDRDTRDLVERFGRLGDGRGGRCPEGVRPASDGKSKV